MRFSLCGNLSLKRRAASGGGGASLPAINFGPELSGTNRVGEQVTVYAEATLSPTHYKFQKYLGGVASGAAVVQTSMPYDYTLLIGDQDQLAKWGVSASTDSVTYGTEAFTLEIFVQSATRAAPVLERTSADNDLPMTWTSYLADGYPGDVRRRQLSSDDSFTTLQFDGQKEVTVTELESPFVSDWSAVDGYPVATSPLYVREMLYTSDGAEESDWSNIISNIPVSNFALWNSADKTANVTLLNGDKTADYDDNGSICAVRSNQSSADFVYWELFVDQASHTMHVGFGDNSQPLNTFTQTNTITWEHNFNSGGRPGDFGVNAVLGFATNGTLGKGWMNLNNGAWFPSGDPAAGTGGFDISAFNDEMFAFIKCAGNGMITLRAAHADCTGTIPTGAGELS